MMFSCKILIAISLLVSSALAAVQSDEIINLPGLDYAINFKHYSGYLDGSAQDHLHYWFTESQNDPTTDPVLLWMNGGPGCSSLMGLLTELGPYRVKDDGSGVQENIYGWNKNANVLFLEAPHCVGFSYTDGSSCDTGDDATSLSNYEAIKDFFNKFSEFTSNEFYISGESYAGIYVPTLAKRVLDGNSTYPMNLKGFVIGNGLLSYKQNENSLMFFGNYHALLGDVLWDSLVTECCENAIPDEQHCNFQIANSSLECDGAILKAQKVLYYNGINMYDLYGECAQAASFDIKRYDRQAASRSNLFRSHEKSEPETRDDPPCLDNTAARTYLNANATRQALHIPDSVQDWDVCTSLTYAREYDDVLSLLTELTLSIRGLIYNGDTDMACNVMGNIWGVKSLALNVEAEWQKWMEPSSNQVAGFRTRYTNLDFVTFRGAGHMVPEDKPIEALQMITAYLTGNDYGPP